MSDGPYDFARERTLAERGEDLVHDDQGVPRPVRRGTQPPVLRRVGGELHDAADVPDAADL